MKTIPVADAIHRVSEITKVLSEGGLACVPVGGTYRIVADARSEDAITRLAQSKRRAKNHPSLVLTSDLSAARTMVHGTSWPVVKRLAEGLWPGPLTLTLPPSNDLSPKLRKLLARATGAIGIRVPHEPLAAALVRAFRGPLVVSSANLEQKPGAGSAATVQQRFVRTVDVWVDAGDIPPGMPSTIVEVTEDGWKVVRDGAVALAKIEQALKTAA